MTAAGTTDYTAEFTVAAAPDTVLAALTRPREIATWWTAWTTVTGSGKQGGQLHFSFGGDDQLVVHVAQDGPAVIEWSVTDCAVLPDWAGTRPTFTLRQTSDGTAINFRHVGLAPALECFDTCRASWDQYLASLRAHLATS